MRIEVYRVLAAFAGQPFGSGDGPGFGRGSIPMHKRAVPNGGSPRRAWRAASGRSFGFRP
ncbi:hypothetical protein J2792_002863 [Novosphingobium capsulatum]|uniref:Uncharacterized protein n=1 Tax=Novosphingobium capsulatum TaxID=13688 RepID=A0ABU1MNQ6_9SPHN|nr:hypothetical protein [Novosphingobium capsulatum]